MISKTELLLMIREAGFLLYDAGYGPEVLHTEPLRYSQKCFERFAEMVIDHYRSKSALDRVAQRAQEQEPTKTTLSRGVNGVCSRSACECEREKLGSQCIWLRPTDAELERRTGLRFTKAGLALNHNDPASVQNQVNPMQEPVAKMTAGRAMYFMERFKREEKMLGPNEQAALDFVISMLDPATVLPDKPVAWRTFDGEGGYEYRSYENNECYADEWAQRNPNHVGWVEPLCLPPPDRKPLTKGRLLELYNQLPNWGMDMDSLPQGLEKFARVVERAHGIK